MKKMTAAVLSAALLAAVQLCVCGWMLADLVPALLPDAEAAAEVGDPAAALDEYALWNPDMLFIHDLTLAVDTRLFPDVSEGIPHNVVCWGGTCARPPRWSSSQPLVSTC